MGIKGHTSVIRGKKYTYHGTKGSREAAERLGEGFKSGIGGNGEYRVKKGKYDRYSVWVRY